MVDKVTQSQLNKNRLDKFLLVINLPPVMRNINNQSLRVRSNATVNENSVQFSVFGSVIPEISVPEVAAGYSGQTYKLSSHSRPPYNNITVNFTIDNRFNNYWAIYKWLDILNNEKESFYNSDDPTIPPVEYTKLPVKLSPSQYQTDLTIFGKDEFDVNVIKFTYTKAFPVLLNGIDYNYREPGEIESSFSFAFSQFFAELL